MIFGTYVHGVFDSAAVCGRIRELLAEKKHVSAAEYETGGLTVSEYKEQQYDKLAKGLRESLDMDMIYKILNREM